MLRAAAASQPQERIQSREYPFGSDPGKGRQLSVLSPNLRRVSDMQVETSAGASLSVAGGHPAFGDQVQGAAPDGRGSHRDPGDAAELGTDGDPGGLRPARALSPSRAGDFMTCPLLYRFRVIDRLPEPPSAAAARGTLVHAVLERLFDEPAARRTPQAARDLIAPQWERLVAEEPELAGLFGDDEQRGAWMSEASGMLDRYFTLEDPTRLEPAHRELSVQAVLESGLMLRGYIDRLDVAVTGEIRIVDYKTGSAPREDFEARALFQMKFYALVLWRTGGTVPRLLQLIYLGNGEIVRYAPDEADLLATERKINALWRAIERARSSGDWRPRRGRLCGWCAHQAICPAFGGTPPPLPPLPAEAPAGLETPPLPENRPFAGEPATGEQAAAGEPAAAGPGLTTRD
jgi:putative RecB family exonuclease